jgi:hypothetical protein
VSHSKGGIVAKYFLVNSNEKGRIKKVINISAPFKGSILGYVGIYNAGELTPKSDLIKSLSKITSVNKMFVNIYARIDNLIINKEKPTLEGAKNIELDVVGHQRILYSREALEIIRQELA